MKPPIIMVDQKDISLFSTVEKACSAFEADDIDYGISGYDSDGHRLCLEKGFRKVKHHFLLFTWMSTYRSLLIRDCEPLIDSSSELRKHLVEFLVISGFHKENLETMNIQDLLKEITISVPIK
jgi:hypothetical protein